MGTDATTEWVVGARVVGDLRKVTSGGAAATFTYKIYEAITTVGDDPTVDVGTVSPGVGTNWKEVGSVNEWAWANETTADQATNATTLQVVLTPGSIINAVGFANLSSATSVNITLNDPVEGEVHNEDYDLVSDSGINNWYDFYFEETVQWQEWAVFDLPPYSAGTCTITLSVASGTVGVGAIIAGQALTIGDTQYGAASYGITDYTTNDYIPELGRVVSVEGNFIDEANFSIYVGNSKFSAVKQQLRTLRNTPIYWSPDADRTGSGIFGKYRDFEMTIQGPSLTLCNLEVAGL
tara:strand:+ start:1615 stop:2496 length:882 start_codon:yes stop_codon:yes gene_type:complete